MQRSRRSLLATLMILPLLLAGCTNPLAPATAHSSQPHASAETAFLGASEDPAAGSWKPFVLESAREVRPPAPPAKGSAGHQRDVDELRQAMSGASTAQIQGAARWNGGVATLPWTNVTLDLIAQGKIPPPKAARALALVHVAMYDATVASWDAKHAFDRAPPAADGITPLGSATSTPSYPSEHAAIAAAASSVLMELFPDQKTRLEGELAAAQRARLVTGLNWPTDVSAGTELGRAVAQRVVARAVNDGSDATVSWTPPEGPGSWQPTPPHHAPPLLPHWGKVGTWLLKSGDQVRAPPPPDVASEEVRAQMREVYTIGTTLTPRQKEIALYWADGPGDVTAPGHWNVIAIEHMADETLTTPQAARLFALLNVALHDTAVAVWDTKYTYATIRPLTYLRENVDPAFETYLMSPPFPAYVSGHAGLAGAASTVLARFLPDDAVQLRALASEAAMSRLYSGSHIRLDNEVGLDLGARVAALAIERARADGGWSGLRGSGTPLHSPSALKPWAGGQAADPVATHAASQETPTTQKVAMSGTISGRGVSQEHVVTLPAGLSRVTIVFGYEPGSPLDVASADLLDPEGRTRVSVQLAPNATMEVGRNLVPGEWKLVVRGDSPLGVAGRVAKYIAEADLVR